MNPLPPLGTGIRRTPKSKKAVPLSLKEFGPWQPPSGRDWAALPLDLILYVFHKLGTVELLLGGAAGVCRSWRRAARDEPVLWSHIDMRGYSHRCERWHVPFNALVQAALRHSAGRCEAFWTDAGNDDVLRLLAEQARSLKSLRLISCVYFTMEGFTSSVKMFHLLEELEISECFYLHNDHNTTIEALANSCPLLKHLRLIKWIQYYYRASNINNDGEARVIAGMHKLRSLELCGNRLTCEGLMAILDNCAHLELLITRNCPNLNVDGALLAKCARIKIVTLRGDDYPYYEVSDRSYCYDDWLDYPCSICYFLCIHEDVTADDVDDVFFTDYIQDYYDYSRYLYGVYVTDFDDDENTNMLSKNQRRYLKINS